VLTVYLFSTPAASRQENPAAAPQSHHRASAANSQQAAVANHRALAAVRAAQAARDLSAGGRGRRGGRQGQECDRAVGEADGEGEAGVQGPGSCARQSVRVLGALRRHAEARRGFAAVCAGHEASAGSDAGGPSGRGV